MNNKKNNTVSMNMTLMVIRTVFDVYNTYDGIGRFWPYSDNVCTYLSGKKFEARVIMSMMLVTSLTCT